jgi:nitrogen fixation protein FixH
MKNNAKYIPILIIGFIVSFTVIIVGFVHIAYSTFTGEVTEKAYQKGLDFGKIYKTSLMQPDDGVLAEIAIVDGQVNLKLNTVFNDYSLEAKVVKPVSSEFDRKLEFKSVGDHRFEAILPKLSPGNWEIRVKVVAKGDDYVFNRRFVVSDKTM